ncbi:MAG: hypothetical protein R2911_23535 [Caldilineaceae bacterium]
MSAAPMMRTRALLPTLANNSVLVGSPNAGDLVFVGKQKMVSFIRARFPAQSWPNHGRANYQ